MYEVKQHERIIDGRRLTTFSREICSANYLKVEAGTTGPRGGDSGHGCRTYVRLEDLGGTDLRVRKISNAGEGGVEIVLGGDCELTTFLMTLKFMTKVLEDQIHDIYD